MLLCLKGLFQAVCRCSITAAHDHERDARALADVVGSALKLALQSAALEAVSAHQDDYSVMVAKLSNFALYGGLDCAGLEEEGPAKRCASIWSQRLHWRSRQAAARRGIAHPCGPWIQWCRRWQGLALSAWGVVASVAARGSPTALPACFTLLLPFLQLPVSDLALAPAAGRSTLLQVYESMLEVSEEGRGPIHR